MIFERLQHALVKERQEILNRNSGEHNGLTEEESKELLRLDRIEERMLEKIEKASNNLELWKYKLNEQG
jgi:DNA-directed RNA polymerase subunit H (RpoH/RPB5)